MLVVNRDDHMLSITDNYDDTLSIPLIRLETALRKTLNSAAYERTPRSLLVNLRACDVTDPLSFVQREIHVAEAEPLPIPSTWQQLYDILIQLGFDQDEWYVIAKDFPISLDSPINNTPHVRRIACSWSDGANEGFIASVALIMYDRATKTLYPYTIMYGKFWDRQHAEEATLVATRLLLNVPLTYQPPKETP